MKTINDCRTRTEALKPKAKCWPDYVEDSFDRLVADVLAIAESSGEIRKAFPVAMAGK